MTVTPPIGPGPAAKPRSAAIALLLNFFGMGAGYLYLGRPWRALVLLVASLLALAFYFSDLGRLLASPPAALAVVGVSVAGLLVMLADTALIARRMRRFVPRWYNRVAIYAGLVVASFLAGSADLLSGGRIKPAVRSYHVPSLSMQPGLELGDRFIADMRAYAAGASPRRGDIVVFRHPRDTGIVYVKRVIGLPGERVRLLEGIVHIDGRAVPTTDGGEVVTSGSGAAQAGHGKARKMLEALPGGPTITVYDSDAKGPLDTTVEVTIPADQFLMLGDNRDNSADSRLPVGRGGVGLVPRALIEGRAAWIFWSRDFGRLFLRL